VTVAVNVTDWPKVEGLTDELIDVLVASGLGAETVIGEDALNSDVLSVLSVAVAVTNTPPLIELAKLAVKFTLLPLIVTVLDPMYVLPSPKPVPSGEGLTKKSMM
jgi:hypothetical protein